MNFGKTTTFSLYNTQGSNPINRIDGNGLKNITFVTLPNKPTNKDRKRTVLRSIR